VNALQWLVLIFEASFCSIAQQSQIDDNKSLREGALSPQPAHGTFLSFANKVCGVCFCLKSPVYSQLKAAFFHP